MASATEHKLMPKKGEKIMKCHPKLASGFHFKDYVLFHEYFHGDNGRGVGASHQTGWTGLIAKLLRPRRKPVETPKKNP